MEYPFNQGYSKSKSFVAVCGQNWLVEYRKIIFFLIWWLSRSLSDLVMMLTVPKQKLPYGTELRYCVKSIALHLIIYYIRTKEEKNYIRRG